MYNRYKMQVHILVYDLGGQVRNVVDVRVLVHFLRPDKADVELANLLHTSVTSHPLPHTPFFFFYSTSQSTSILYYTTQSFTYLHTLTPGPALAHRVSRPRGTGSVGDSVGEGQGASRAGRGAVHTMPRPTLDSSSSCSGSAGANAKGHIYIYIYIYTRRGAQGQ